MQHEALKPHRTSVDILRQENSNNVKGHMRAVMQVGSHCIFSAYIQIPQRQIVELQLENGKS